MDLQTFRLMLNQIDDRMAELFVQRMNIVNEIALWKQQQGVPVLDRSREESVMNRLTEAHPEHSESIRQLYEGIFQTSRDAQTQILRSSFGLLGHPLGHSLSPAIHAKLGTYPYRLFDISPDRLPGFLQEGLFAGINVTIPYKQEILSYCQTISPLAKRIGAVNTIVRQPDGSLHGDNTDFHGMKVALQHANMSLKGRNVLILGGGATSRTAQAVAEEGGAREIIKVTRQGPVNYKNVNLYRMFEVILQTTPVGMYPNNGEQLIDLQMFPHCVAVFDVVYHPLKTALLLQAEELGIPYENGLTMLVAQAVKASEQFTRRNLANTSLYEITASLKSEMQNVVLIGMPGCGKTTLGRILAERLGRPFFDSDEILMEELGKTPAEVITQLGEEAFRKAESEVLSRLGKGKRSVIATGGGSLLRKSNQKALRQNGFLVWIQRELPLLSREGRPLSGDLLQLQKLYEKREPLYRGCAEAVVENNSSLELAVERIREVYHEVSRFERS